MKLAVSIILLISSCLLFAHSNEIKLDRSKFPENMKNFYTTNPSRPVVLPDGETVIMAVREQAKQFDPKVEAWPGKSQVGLYTAKLKDIEKDGLSFKRIRTLITHKSLWHEDPSLAVINGEILVGYVRVKYTPNVPKSRAYKYHTIFKKLDLEKMKLGEQVFIGPQNMKDVRLAQLKNGRVAIITRPRAKVADRDFGIGYIGYTEVKSLSDVTDDILLDSTPILRPSDANFSYYKNYKGEWWVGGNDIVVRSDGKLTIYGHIAAPVRDEVPGPYSMLRFEIDPENLKAARKDAKDSVELLATPDFFKGSSDGIRANTLFPGGPMIFEKNGKVEKVLVTAGINDAYIGYVEVPEKLGTMQYQKLSSISCKSLLMSSL